MQRIVARMLLVSAVGVCGSAVAQNSASQVASLRDALIPIEVLEPDPAFATGEVAAKGVRWDAAILAAQPARVARAIVLEDGKVGITKGSVLNLALLDKVTADANGKALLDVPPAQQAWCENWTSARATITCYRDLDGDLKLEAEATGFLPRPDVLSLNRIGAFKTITPLAYRPARAEELLPLRLEYASCVNADDKLRYAMRIRRVKQPLLFGGVTQGECTQFATPLESGAGVERVYQVDRMKVAVFDEAGKQKTRVVEAMPTGAILGHVRSDRRFTDAIATKSFREERAEQAQSLPFLFFANAPTVASEPVKRGQEILSGEVAHSITGRLVSPLIKPGFFGGNREPYFAADTAMFGVTMGNQASGASLDPQIVWCVPKNAKRKRTECMVQSNTSHQLVTAYSPFVVEALSFSNNSPVIESPIVERGPVDFGAPIHLEIRFEQWKKKEAILSYSIDRQTERDKDVTTLPLRRGEDGGALLLVGSKLIKLTPVAEDPTAAKIVMEREPQSGDDAHLDDAYRVLRIIEKAQERMK